MGRIELQELGRQMFLREQVYNFQIDLQAQIPDCKQNSARRRRNVQVV